MLLVGPEFQYDGEDESGGGGDDKYELARKMGDPVDEVDPAVSDGLRVCADELDVESPLEARWMAGAPVYDAPLALERLMNAGSTSRAPKLVLCALNRPELDTLEGSTGAVASGLVPGRGTFVGSALALAEAGSDVWARIGTELT